MTFSGQIKEGALWSLQNNILKAWKFFMWLLTKKRFICDIFWPNQGGNPLESSQNNIWRLESSLCGPLLKKLHLWHFLVKSRGEPFGWALRGIKGERYYAPPNPWGGRGGGPSSRISLPYMHIYIYACAATHWRFQDPVQMPIPMPEGYQFSVGDDKHLVHVIEGTLHVLTPTAPRHCGCRRSSRPWNAASARCGVPAHRCEVASVWRNLSAQSFGRCSSPSFFVSSLFLLNSSWFGLEAKGIMGWHLFGGKAWKKEVCW